MGEKIGAMALGVLFIYLGALVAFDITWSDLKIPITGQSLAVLVVGYLLGRQWGTLAVIIYLLLGGLGLPLFAGGKSGWPIFFQGSGGFLYGFIFAAYVIGAFGAYFSQQKWYKYLIAMTLGTAIIILFGVMHLASLYGFDKALEYGFYPFWQGAIVKIFLGAMIVWISEPWVKDWLDK